jgi:DNA-binding NarL/FixJ family response regulator
MHPKSAVVEVGKEADNVKILVVDDQVLIREALRGVLKEVKGDATVLEASSCNKAMQVIAEHPDLDLILSDLNLPDRDGLSVLTELGERYPAISVVVLSAEQDRGNVARALDLGAVGFIPKSGQREVMVSALQLVFAGGIYIPPEFPRRPIAEEYLELLHKAVPAVETIGLLVGPSDDPLSQAEARRVQSAARTLGLRLLVFKIATVADVAPALATLVEQQAGADSCCQ